MKYKASLICLVTMVFLLWIPSLSLDADQSDKSETHRDSKQVCGDVSGDMSISAIDIAYLNSYIFDQGAAPPTYLDANADGCAGPNVAVNIADAIPIVNFVFFGALAPSGCANTTDCSQSVAGNQIRVGNPPYTLYAGGDSVKIPLYITTSTTLSALTVALEYTSLVGETIASVDWTGSVFSPDVRDAYFDTGGKQVLLGGHFIVSGNMSSQSDALFATLNAQVSGGKAGEDYGFSKSFVSPAGEFIFVTSGGSIYDPDLVVPASPIVVTNTANSGDGSLSWAITEANNNSGADVIEFDVSGTISPTTALPTLTDDNTTLFGFSAPSGPRTLIIDGTGSGIANGLQIDGDHCEIRDLVIYGFNDAQIDINGDTNLVAGCYINVDEDGETFRGDGSSRGIDVSGSSNKIGDRTDENDRNVITCGGGAFNGGVHVRSSGDSSLVEGNYIGTRASGDERLINYPFSGNGIMVQDQYCEIVNNVIGGHEYGIWLTSGIVPSIIQGNRIGINASDTDSIPNDQGFWIDDQVDSLVIQQNYICGNNQYGIYSEADDCNINNNFIGMTAAFDTIGNGFCGIRLTDGAEDNIISENTIVGNGWGGGSIPGIIIDNNAASSVRNTISQNAIYLNTGLGIDLNFDGETLNDIGDADTGPNDLLNFPDIDSVFMNPDSSFITYGRAADSAIIEFFLAHPANDSTIPADPSGYGEAYQYIGSDTCDETGKFVYTIPNTIPQFSQITATATDTFGNTSEFCENFVLTSAPLIIVAYSPVNLQVTDPDGGFIGRDEFGALTQTIFPASYTEIVNDSVHINFPLVGEYLIEVVSEDGADPEAVYSIGIRIDGTAQCIIVLEGLIPAFGEVDSYSYDVEEGYHYINGDVDRNEVVNILDIIYLIGYKFAEGPEPYPLYVADADCDLTVNILDIIYLIDYKFKDGPEPCPLED